MRAALGDRPSRRTMISSARDDRRKAVGDDERRPAPAHEVKRRLDLLLGLRIERRRRFVENQDRRRLEDGAGNRHALLFAARQFEAAFADHRL
jgi:hypothetical protein